MHYPLTDIQADFDINRLVRYQITQKEIFPQTTDGRTEGRTDRRTDVAHDNTR